MMEQKLLFYPFFITCSRIMWWYFFCSVVFMVLSSFILQDISPSFSHPHTAWLFTNIPFRRHVVHKKAIKSLHYTYGHTSIWKIVSRLLYIQHSLALVMYKIIFSYLNYKHASLSHSLCCFFSLYVPHICRFFTLTSSFSSILL